MRSATAKSRRRIRFAWPILVLLYVGLIGRIAYLQTTGAQDLRKRASADRKDCIELTAERGRILDRNGKVLAFNIGEQRVVLHPKLIKDKRLAAQILSKHTGLTEADVFNRLTSGKAYVLLVGRISPESAAKLNRDLLDTDAKAGIKGVDIESFSRRVYPLGSVTAKVVGAMGTVTAKVDGKPVTKSAGISGVEMFSNLLLEGKPGLLWADFDRSGGPILTRPRKTLEPIPGHDIVLTIDSRIQFAADKALRQQIEKYRAQAGSCIVMDPFTGEILALAEYPSYDPSHIRPADVRHMGLSALRGVYEPGSTMKLLTAAAAMRYGLAGVTSRCTGAIQVGGHTLRCPCSVRRREPGMPVTIARMLKYSCNTEASTLSRRMGAVKFYDELERFGLFQRWDIAGLGQSAGGLLADPKKKPWPQVGLADVGFGQAVATSRINLLTAYGAVANGGMLVRPKIIKEVWQSGVAKMPSGTPYAARRAVSVQTSRKLLQFLQGTVEEGTGKNARIEGFAVGGKTATAQIAAGHGRGFIPGAFIASFAGIAPLDDPKVAILVAVERPRGSTHGATVAAPVFKEVAEKALWCAGKAPKGSRSAGAVGVGKRQVFGGSGTGRDG